MSYRIVYKCDRDCEYPDAVQHDPMDDNMRCSCGGTKWGHYTNVEDEVKKANWENK